MVSARRSFVAENNGFKDGERYGTGSKANKKAGTHTWDTLLSTYNVSYVDSIYNTYYVYNTSKAI